MSLEAKIRLKKQQSGKHSTRRHAARRADACMLHNAAQGHQLPIIVRELVAGHNTKALDNSSDHLQYRQSPTATAHCLRAPIRASGSASPDFSTSGTGKRTSRCVLSATIAVLDTNLRRKRPLFPKADVQVTQNLPKRRSAFGHKRTFANDHYC